MNKLGQSLARASLRAKDPHYDRYINATKMPVTSRIVALGPLNHVFFQPLFSEFFKEQTQYSNRELMSFQGEENESKDFTEQDVIDGFRKNLGFPSRSVSTIKGQVFVDCPLDVRTAELLDQAFDGVNLAILFEYPETIQNMLQKNYYNCPICQRGFSNTMDITMPPLPGSDCGVATENCGLTNQTENYSDLVDGYYAQFNPVIQYYEETGVLMRFYADTDLSADELYAALQREIRANIKI